MKSSRQACNDILLENTPQTEDAEIITSANHVLTDFASQAYLPILGFVGYKKRKEPSGFY